MTIKYLTSFVIYFVLHVLLKSAEVHGNLSTYNSIKISGAEWPNFIYETFAKDLPSIFACASLCETKRFAKKNPAT